MRRLFVLCFGLLLVASSAPVLAQNAIQEEIDEVAREIDELQTRMDAADAEEHYWIDQVAATSTRMRDIQEDLTRAEIVLADLQLSIRDTQAAVDLAIAEIGAKEFELANTREEIEATRDMVVVQAVEIFKRGGSQIQVAFDYESAQDAAVAVKYGTTLIEETFKAVDALEVLRSLEQQQIELVESEKAKLDEQRERLESASTSAEAQKATVVERRRLAEVELVSQRALLQTVKAAITEFEDELDGLEEEQEDLGQLLAEATRANGETPGSLYRPVPGAVSSPFGPRVHPILGYTRTHTGVDMNARSGDDIFAASNGRVILAGSYGGYGNTVIIDHGGGMATLYAHQTRVAVSKGETVQIGQVIGYIGSTGLSTGPHLHFEVRLDGRAVDPVPYFQS
ncbi:MAG: peptidoglycan DD-metalloendopeptidase family protein [Acidimicrobiia bacterium]|nr:peptidoglycan DD-metalloendopeptidase family protein [Acidimicrobiia bacterium]